MQILDASGAPINRAELPREPEAAPDKRSEAKIKAENRKRAISDLERHRAAGELPHEFLLRITREGQVDGEDVGLDTRIECAKAAAPYFAPRLSSVELVKNVGDDALLAIIMQGLNDPELAPLVERIVKEAGFASGLGRVVASQEAEGGSGRRDFGEGSGEGEREASELGDGGLVALRSDQPLPAPAGSVP